MMQEFRTIVPQNEYKAKIETFSAKQNYKAFDKEKKKSHLKIASREHAKQAAKRHDSSDSESETERLHSPSSWVSRLDYKN